MTWNYPSTPPRPGVWDHWSYGADIEGWSLRCGDMFHADVRRVGEGGAYYGMLNCWPMGHDPDPQVLMARIDRAIVMRVRAMTAPYRLVLAREKAHAANSGPVEMGSHRALASMTTPPDPETSATLGRQARDGARGR